MLTCIVWNHWSIILILILVFSTRREVHQISDNKTFCHKKSLVEHRSQQTCCRQIKYPHTFSVMKIKKLFLWFLTQVLKKNCIRKFFYKLIKLWSSLPDKWLLYDSPYLHSDNNPVYKIFYGNSHEFQFWHLKWFSCQDGLLLAIQIQYIWVDAEVLN